jgi:DNA-binding GntR family transcriptional regulator
LHKIEHQTLNDQAYAALKQGLIAGDFKPGQPLVIRSLARSFGISTTPIREALQRLVAERTLEMQPNRSVVVPVLTLPAFTELSRIRCAMEGLAAEMAAKFFTDTDLQELERGVGGMDQAVADKDSRRYLDLNREFHFRIYEKARAPILLDLIRDLWGRIGPYMHYLMETDAYVPQSNEIHRQLLPALAARTEGLARMLIVEDISRAAEVLSRRFLASQTSPRSNG